MNAFYCEGRGWVLSADEMNKMEFRGQYANIRCWNQGQHVLMSRHGIISFYLCQISSPVLTCPKERPACTLNAVMTKLGQLWSSHVVKTNKKQDMVLKAHTAQCRPTGLVRVDFHDGEEFSWNPLVTVIQHIILGKPLALLWTLM